MLSNMGCGLMAVERAVFSGIIAPVLVYYMTRVWLIVVVFQQIKPEIRHVLQGYIY
jgi:hypothetical protein